MSAPVVAIRSGSNADLIADCARLGYLRADWVTVDPTYGLGRFWRRWRPDVLLRHDLDPERAPDGVADFRRLPYRDRSVDAVVFDPPYKLNGQAGSHALDDGYGVASASRWQDRHELIRDGITEAARIVKPGGLVLVKCQDQVSSGRVRWQTIEFVAHADTVGLRLVDMLHLHGARPQPPGRRQVHARRNYSTLLVLTADRAARSNPRTEPRRIG